MLCLVGTEGHDPAFLYKENKLSVCVEEEWCQGRDGAGEEPVQEAGHASLARAVQSCALFSDKAKFEAAWFQRKAVELSFINRF